MSISIRRLGPGDEATLALLAHEDADFDVDGRSGPLQPLLPVMAQRYLANPAVLHWVAIIGHTVAGFLYCVHLPLRSDAGHEVLIYEIGVRSALRRRGVGRALMTHLEQWMQLNGVAEVWVGGDNPEAVQFYRACGFEANEPQPIYMSRELSLQSRKMAPTLPSAT